MNSTLAGNHHPAVETRDEVGRRPARRIAHYPRQDRSEDGKAALDNIVEFAVEIARPLIDERRHQLTLALPTDPVYLWRDPARLAQVLSNLLHNAAK